MKFVSRTDTMSLAATVEGTPLKLESIEGYSICASWTGGTVNGTFKLQACNNPFIDNVGFFSSGLPFQPDPAAVWVDITGSSVAASGAGTQFWNVTDVYYQAVRVVYTRTAGTGTATIYINAKGIT